MSEPAAEYDDGEYEGGRPLGLYVLVGVVIALVAVSGLFAIGYIPPVAKIGGHGTTSTTRGNGTIQFITVTSTYPGPTTTVSLPGHNTTLTSSTVLTTTQTSTSTSTQTSTQTLTSVSTTTSLTTILQPTTTTTTTTVTNTTTTTVAPTSPLSINVTMDPPANPSSLYAGEHFTISVAVRNTLPATSLTLNAYQVSPMNMNTPQVLSFYPQVPESLTPVIGDSSYTIEGNVSQTAPTGDYQMVVEVDASSPGVTVNSVSQQYIVHLSEPLSFTGYHFVNSTANFNGTCMPSTILYSGNTNWYWRCAITAAPNATGTIDFNVTNSANVPICISTALQSSTMTGFVNMDPYPFCPDGLPGVYVPANVTNWLFTYTIVNGGTAGLQTVFFLFQRTGS